MKYIYGPIKSRRLGNSLGINIIPPKVCSLDCIYCQLGLTTHKTTQIKDYIDINEVLEEVREFFKGYIPSKKPIDYLTISGAGEPTLNLNIQDLISGLKKLTSIPVAVITNSSLLTNPFVRKGLLEADLVIPSLDAVAEEMFKEINQPGEGMFLYKIIEGLIDFKREFKGKIWLEVMVLKGLNDSPKDAERLKEIVERIKPDKIHLNTPVRAPKNSGVFSPDKRVLERIKDTLGEKCEII